jgi:folylpolyglutamate synthase/dihydropteroate synthase
MDDLTEHYLGMLQDSSECVKVYTSHIQNLEERIRLLQKEIKEGHEKLLYYMAKDSFSVSRHEFSTCFVTVKNRRETDAEWALFQDTFRFRLQIEVYKWIDSLE